MEPQDGKEHGERHGSGSPPEGKPDTGNGGVVAVETADLDWISQPDRTITIEISQIRAPNAGLNPNILIVPIESDQGSRNRSHEKNGGGKANDSGQKEGHKSAAGQAGNRKKDNQEDQDGSGNRHEDQNGQAGRAPSLTSILVFSGLVALVCGVVGAAGYSHFFEKSSKVRDEKSSGKGSDSSKDSDSGKGSKSGKSSDPGSNSSSSQVTDSGQNSDSSIKGSDAGKGLQAEAAWLAAVKELHQAQASEKEARSSADQTKAVLDFLKNTLLSAGRSGDASLADAFWAGGQGKDLTLRKAVDATESRVAEAFPDRPLAEASVREMLGKVYLSLGDAVQSVKQYERAYELRQATQGDHHSDTAACRNQLATAYRLAGRTAEAGRLFERKPDTTAHASALAVGGSILLVQRRPAEAELKLRECLAIRQNLQPDDWTTFDTMSLLGEALLSQKKFADAEPLLLSGYSGLKQRKSTISSQDKQLRLTKAVERLVVLYEAWAKNDEAMKWRKNLETMEDSKKS